METRPFTFNVAFIFSDMNNTKIILFSENFFVLGYVGGNNNIIYLYTCITGPCNKEEETSEGGGGGGPGRGRAHV